MRIAERKYFDAFKKSIGTEIPKLIESFDFSENRGEFEYLTTDLSNLAKIGNQIAKQKIDYIYRSAII